MICPKCKGHSVYCLDSRPYNGMTKRRRRCIDCGYRFTTIEIDMDFYRDVNLVDYLEMKRKENILKDAVLYIEGAIDGLKTKGE